MPNSLTLTLTLSKDLWCDFPWAQDVTDSLIKILVDMVGESRMIKPADIHAGYPDLPNPNPNTTVTVTVTVTLTLTLTLTPTPTLTLLTIPRDLFSQTPYISNPNPNPNLNPNLNPNSHFLTRSLSNPTITLHR